MCYISQIAHLIPEVTEKESYDDHVYSEYEICTRKMREIELVRVVRT